MTVIPFNLSILRVIQEIGFKSLQINSFDLFLLIFILVEWELELSSTYIQRRNTQYIEVVSKFLPFFFEGLHWNILSSKNMHNECHVYS